MKYAQNPTNNNEVSILEEDHYYPNGLKHEGYNGNHQILFQNDGQITLTDVTPFLGDSHTYKFGGKEYQTEFDINSYDFGARNYDPALGRWMNIDPLAELMRRHSPYNYAFNNPVYFIDPDGMMPGGFGGFGTGSFESYDFGSGNESGALKGESEGSETSGSINSQNGEVAGNAATAKHATNDTGDSEASSADSGDGGGCPPGVDCEGMQRGNIPVPVGDRTTSSSVEIEIRKEVKTIDNFR